MPTYEAIVEESGKVQLPDALARKLGIKPGHRVEFFETVDGEVFFHAIVGTTQGWKGMFGLRPGGPPSPSVRWTRASPTTSARSTRGSNGRAENQGLSAP